MGNPHTEERKLEESGAGLREYAATRLDQFKRFVDSNLRLLRSGSLLVLGGSAVFFFLRSRAVSEGCNDAATGEWGRHFLVIQMRRFRSAADIPPSYWSSQKFLRGQLIVDKDKPSFLFYHQPFLRRILYVGDGIPQSRF